MGDLVTHAVEGNLYYLPLNQFERLSSLSLDKSNRSEIFSDMCRLNTLYMIARAGSGHIGSSFSSMDIFSWLLLEELGDDDIFFSSKGHDAPGYYSALLGAGKINFDLIHSLRRIGGLPGHPDISIEGIATNTGSLGMGVSKAKGMVFANRMKGINSRIFVLTGDGELQEGQFWESLISAVNFKMREITLIIDHNKLQSDTFVQNVSDLGDLASKLDSFGWCVERCNGNDINSLKKAYSKIQKSVRPKAIIADTIKGKGVSFMEHTSLDSDLDMYKFHSGAPDAKSYNKAAQELIEKIKIHFKKVGESEPKFEIFHIESVVRHEKNAQRLVNSYSTALLEQAEVNKNLIVLDADLVQDNGLIPFKERFPERFVECGIAEQDMVSFAGGLALKGMIPVVHSFSCFLSSRPNEQIYNNCTEKTKIIYVGSLAGILPAGPGHSHQAIRDISTIASMPGMIIIEPGTEDEVQYALSWAVSENKKSTYIRLCSTPVEITFNQSSYSQLRLGYGYKIRSGGDYAIIAYGPLMLELAKKTSEFVEENFGIRVSVINMPWLNCVEPNWVIEGLKYKKILVIENHYVIGGLFDRVNKAFALCGIKDVDLLCYGLESIPFCGSNEEVMNAHGFTIDNIANVLLGN